MTDTDWAGFYSSAVGREPRPLFLVEGLEVVDLTENDHGADSFVGPKHWHIFEPVARCPVDG